MMPPDFPPGGPPALHTVLRRMAQLPRHLMTWRAKRRASPLWTVAVAAILAVMGLPIATLVVLALSPAENIWPHLASTVLPRALRDTFLLLAGVGLVTAAVGTAAAWVVTMYRFPGRAVIDRLLVLPLAMPTYIVAYCYVDLLDYAGPVQSSMRSLFGGGIVKSWFPEVRSLGGAILMLSAVLYPYVYLTVRASFVQQSVCVLEVARTLGRTPAATFWAVALPLARPGLAAGVALALMECLNDLGAVQHLGVQTLTLNVYTTWLQRGNLGGAAQIAVVILIFVAVMFAAERASRGGAQFHHTTGRYRSIPFSDLEGWRGFAAAGLCALPVAAGFVLPAAVLVQHAVTFAPEAAAIGLWRAARNSILLAAIAAAAAVAVAILLAYARRIAANGFTRPAVRLAGLGYALPGTVLALGLLIPLAALDHRLNALAGALGAGPLGLVLSGSLFALTLTYTIRFLAVALGSVEAGLERISPNLDAAARTLGESALSALVRVHLPLLVPALGAGGLLVFVDSMKELPATLLLRPFNFDTLATESYNWAAREQFEHAALGALLIVAAGLVPVLLLHKAVAGGRAGGSP